MGTSVPGASASAWIVALLFLAGLAAAGWFLVRYVRRGQGMGAVPKGVQVLGRIALSMNHALVIVDVGGHVLVVGVGDGVRLLERIDDPDVISRLQTLPDGTLGGLLGRPLGREGSPEFRALLDETMNRIRGRGGIGPKDKGDGGDQDA